MKETQISFMEGFTLGAAKAQAASERGEKAKSFDWNKAASIISHQFKLHPDLIAEAGLQGDWHHTGGVIFTNGHPTNAPYTYLHSAWAIPTLILSWDGCEQLEIECYETEGKFNSDSKWDEESLAIIGIPVPENDEDEYYNS